MELVKEGAFRAESRMLGLLALFLPYTTHCLVL
jgi:hypothetical protein